MGTRQNKHSPNLNPTDPNATHRTLGKWKHQNNTDDDGYT